jgi:hypothetical protein
MNVQTLRRWLLIRRLRKALRDVKQGNGFIIWQMQMRVVKGAFAEQTAAHSPWAKIWGRRYQHRKFMEINSLLDDLIADGYIDSAKRESDSKILIRNSSKGEDFCAPTEFLQTLLSKYDKILAPSVLVTIIGFVAVHFIYPLWPNVGQPLLARLHGETQIVAKSADSIDGYIEFILSGGYRNFADAPEEFAVARQQFRIPPA